MAASFRPDRYRDQSRGSLKAGINLLLDRSLGSTRRREDQRHHRIDHISVFEALDNIPVSADFPEARPDGRPGGLAVTA